MTIRLISPTLTHSPPTAKSFIRRSMLPLRRDGLWEIQSGVVRTFSCLENGTFVTFGIWGKGDVVSPLLSQAEPFYMECLTEVEAILLPISGHFNLNTALVEHIRQLNSFIEIKQTRPVDESLLKFLFWLGKKFGRETTGGKLIDLRLTHQEIGEIIGTTRVTVTRLLGILEKREVIKRSGQQSLIIYEPTWYYNI